MCTGVLQEEKIVVCVNGLGCGCGWWGNRRGAGLREDAEVPLFHESGLDVRLLSSPVHRRDGETRDNREQTRDKGQGVQFCGKKRLIDWSSGRQGTRTGEQAIQTGVNNSSSVAIVNKLNIFKRIAPVGGAMI